MPVEFPVLMNIHTRALGETDLWLLVNIHEAYVSAVRRVGGWAGSGHGSDCFTVVQVV